MHRELNESCDLVNDNAEHHYLNDQHVVIGDLNPLFFQQVRKVEVEVMVVVG